VVDPISIWPCLARLSRSIISASVPSLGMKVDAPAWAARVAHCGSWWAVTMATTRNVVERFGEQFGERTVVIDDQDSRGCCRFRGIRRCNAWCRPFEHDPSNRSLHSGARPRTRRRKAITTACGSTVHRRTSAGARTAPGNVPESTDIMMGPSPFVSGRWGRCGWSATDPVNTTTAGRDLI